MVCLLNRSTYLYVLFYFLISLHILLWNSNILIFYSIIMSFILESMPAVNIFIIYWVSNISNIFFFISLVVVLLLIRVLNVPFSANLTLLFLLTLSCFWLSNSYWFLLNNSSVNSLLLSNFNTLLANKLNIIHPLCLYLGTSCVFSFFYLNATISQQYYQQLSLGILRLVSLSGSVLLFTIILGSWWAEQEGTWGGWWAWDPSEVLSLIVCMPFLFILHSRKTRINYFILTRGLLLVFYFLLFSYFFLQINFNLISHNFGNTLTFISDLEYLLYFIVAIVTSLLFNSLGLWRLVSWAPSDARRWKLIWLCFLWCILILSFVISYLDLFIYRYKIVFSLFFLLKFLYFSWVFILYALVVTIFLLRYTRRFLFVLLVNYFYVVYFYVVILLHVVLYRQWTLRGALHLAIILLFAVLFMNCFVEKQVLFFSTSYANIFDSYIIFDSYFNYYSYTNLISNANKLFCASVDLNFYIELLCTLMQITSLGVINFFLSVTTDIVSITFYYYENYANLVYVQNFNFELSLIGVLYLLIILILFFLGRRYSLYY